MRHLLFVVVVVALMLTVLFSPRTVLTQREEPGSPERIVEGAVSDEVVACCTFLANGTSRTCVVTAGQLCDACDRACTLLSDG